MSIRNKLILMLAIPLAALALVGAVGFRGQSTAARDAATALEDDATVQSLNLAIKAIGAERLAVAEDVRGLPIAALRQETNDTLAEAALRAEAEGLDTVQAVLANVDELMVEARATRELLPAIVEMNAATSVLRSVRDTIEVDYPDQDSFAEATSIDLAVDIADRQDSIWLEYIAADEINTDLANRLRTEIAATELLRQQIIDIVPESHRESLNASLASEMDADIARAGIVAVDRFERSEDPLSDDQTLDVVVATHEDWYGHAVQLQEDISFSLAGQSDRAAERQNLFALLGTLGLIVLFGLIYVVYRSVVQPLSDLLEGAEDVANNRLPSVVAELRTMGSSDTNINLEPLPRESDDELGSLVDAFNDVQLTAFDLAVEQARSRRNIAEMFVNLGRRNQKLLQRMLSVISELEHDEKDPDKLEQLFQLDHMTTRMRRNAESLLVVAGTKTPRQWAKPVPAADVVRSALAEVQDYDRIDIFSLADAPMAGNAVADVTHLIAELLENSLQFSEPDTRVNVSSRWKDGDYRIVITDHGFGMTPEELVENNSLIADPPSPDQAPTRFLGLFVVGHLAQRHGIKVELTDATIGGTDARITIPGSLMSEAALPQSDSGDEATGVAEVDDLDLDAEWAKLSAESDLTPTETMADVPVATDFPIQDEAEAVAGDLPVRGEAAPDFGDVSTTTDLPVRGEAAPDFGDVPTTTDVPVRAEAAIDFGDVPSGMDLPVRGEAAPDSGDVPAGLDLPVRAEAAPDFGDVPSGMDLPVRGEAAPDSGDVPAGLDLPVRAEAAPDFGDVPPGLDLPVRGEAAPDFGDVPTTTDLPVRAEAAIDFGDVPTTTDLPVRGDAAIDFGDVPTTTDLPVRGDAAIDFGDFPAPAPAPAATPAPTPVAPPPVPQPAHDGPAAPAAAFSAAADLPVRGEAPAVAAAPPMSDLAGLPLRTPRATLDEVAPAGTAPVAAADSEPTDVTTTASNVGSMLSAFQAGIQRGERTTN